MSTEHWTENTETIVSSNDDLRLMIAHGIDLYRFTVTRCVPALRNHPMPLHRPCCLVGALLVSLSLGLPVAPLQAGDRPPDAGPTATTGFRRASPGYAYAFPRDHGTHDEFRTEWWYYTGHLTTSTGRRFGFELTFFRRGLAPDDASADAPAKGSAWAVHQLYLAHAAVTDVDGRRFLYEEKVSRAGLGKAGADRDQLRVWIDRWRAESMTTPRESHRLVARTPTFTLELRLTPKRAPVIHGLGGVSRKGSAPHQTSHYYSLTRLDTEGRLTLGEASHQVTGLSWMDHEFGSGELGAGLVGWDWFSLQLKNRTDVMVYRLRREDGHPDAASSGTLIFEHGPGVPLAAGDVQISVIDYWESPSSHARYPSGWEMTIPSAELVLTLRPLIREQELITSRSTQVTYWEGAVAVTGRMHGHPVEGQGYVELTGYAHPLTLGH